MTVRGTVKLKKGMIRHSCLDGWNGRYWRAFWDFRLDSARVMKAWGVLPKHIPYRADVRGVTA